MKNKLKFLALSTALIDTPIVSAIPDTATTPTTGQATIENTTVNIVKLGSSEWAPEVG